MENGYYKIDLHVHTPASSDYKGKRSEDEYVNILKGAYDNKVDLICITDHFTVKGYIELMKRKEEVITLWSGLKKRGDTDVSVFHKIEEEYELFRNLHILMGVEIKVSPGIHYVIVFNEIIKPEDVENFLVEISKKEVKDNYGISEYMLPINSLQFFEFVENNFGDSCFIYGAHCDSEAGLIESLKNLRTERLNILKNKKLICLSFNKENTRKYVIDSLIPQIRKERRAPLNFIQCSDFHGRRGEKVGVFYFLVEQDSKKICYKTLFERLSKSELVKTALDTAKERYEHFKKGKIVFPLGELSSEKIREKEDNLKKIICSILNSNKGIIEFEVISKEELKEDINKTIEILLKEILDKTYVFGEIIGIHYQIFQLSKSKYTVLLEFDNSKRLYLYKNICYIIDENETSKIRAAKAYEIEALVAEKIHYRFGKYQDELLREISKDSAKIKKSLLSFSLIYKIDRYIKHIEPLKDFSIDVLEWEPLSDDVKKTVEEYTNGVWNGDFIVLNRRLFSQTKGGRYFQSYLRISPPTYNISLEKPSTKLSEVKKGDILLGPNGACFLVLKDKKMLTATPIFKIRLTSENKVTSNILIGYFKSSFLQWYIQTLGYEDLTDFIIGNPLPLLQNMDKIGRDIDANVNNILVEEEKYFDEISKVKEDDLKLEKITKRHNENCEKYLRNIDKCIFDCLGIKKEGAERIYKDLKKIDVYDYNGFENLKEMFKD